LRALLRDFGVFCRGSAFCLNPALSLSWLDRGPDPPPFECAVSLTAVNCNADCSARGGMLALGVGISVYVLLLCIGNTMLVDSDIYWQIEVGRWILDHRMVPTQDIYSFTRQGAPWISTSWLAQVMFAAGFAAAGWAGPVMLAALALAAALAIFAHQLQRFCDPPLAILLVMAALLLSIHHVLVRPHLVALPLMVGWFAALLAAAERRRAPSPWLLPVLALWANLHGGFVLGLALIAPLALEALWTTEPERRPGLAVRWGLFAVGALLACCATPYGWDTLLGAFRVLDLGEALAMLSEWAPADFSGFGLFEAALLALIGVVLYRRLTLSPPRLLLALGLLHMALSHVRSIESFALLLPLLLAKPWSEQAGVVPVPRASPGFFGVVGAALLLLTASYAAGEHMRYAPVRSQLPVEAVAALQQRHAVRVFNGYEFGGYMITAGLPVFIDGRAELYGERFVTDHIRAVALKDVDLLIRLLEDNRIDATLLAPHEPAAKLLEQLDGWERVHSDEIAVVHARKPR
jgi:hypothetical protein